MSEASSGPRPSRYLVLDTDFWFDVMDQEPENIGSAMVIWLYLSRGHEQTDEICRRVARIGTREWGRRGPAILSILELMVAFSEPRHRYGRPGISKATRDRIFQRDNGVCQYCQTTTGPFHVDHIKPVSRGGSGRDENLCLACAPCNFSKRAKLVSEWNY